MVVDGIDGRRRGKLEEKELVSKPQIQSGCENKRADAGRGGLTCLARFKKSQARTAT